MISADHFGELCHLFPDIRKKLHEGMINYKDPYKKWQKAQLTNINYIKGISPNSLEELTYKLGHEFFEDGQVIFKNGEDLDRVFILADGQVETYVSLQDEDLILDRLKVPGTVLGQYSALDNATVTYSARSVQETNLLVLHRCHLEHLRKTYKDLDDALNESVAKLKEEGAPMLDYQASRKGPTINTLFKEEKFDAAKVFRECVNKFLNLQRFARKKEFKFANLLKFLKNE